MRKVILLVTFFAFTPAFLLFSLVYFLFVSYQNAASLNIASSRGAQTLAYGALPPNLNTFSDKVTKQEGRVEIVRQFLARYNSPLEPHAELIVSLADAYGLDFRLLPAIAMQESNLCKRIPADSFNCWGFGIYGGKITRFSSYPEAIETISRTLATKYKNKGLVTPEEIMSMYTPSSNGSWAFGVNHFMGQLQ